MVAPFFKISRKWLNILHISHCFLFFFKHQSKKQSLHTLKLKHNYNRINDKNSKSILDVDVSEELVSDTELENCFE